VDGNDAIAVYEAACEARQYVKQNGPMLLVCNTYRIAGHSKSDKNVYRSKSEIDAWRRKDPIKRMERYMKENGFSTEDIEGAGIQAAEAIEQAVRFAQNSPYPSVDTIMDNVYSEY
jgi:pyruvate dehydrogenase E1 component alpha subunit